MNPDLLRGNLELILLSILADGPKYGLEIISEAKERTSGYFEFREGSLYPALHRLERARLVDAEFVPSARGPRRRYYRLTASGSERLQEKRREWLEFTHAVEALWAAR